VHDGLVVVDKPAGCTSHDVVARLRRVYEQRRVGHAGTLDPMATGVLVVCLGQAVRLSEYLIDHDKVYRARVRLGVETDTYDATGQVLSERTVNVTPAQVHAALNSFVGKISQRPPAHSAIQRDGVRAYKLARQGIVLEMEPRTVEIYAIHLRAVNGEEIEFDLHCSKGTFVRSLAHDLGATLGCGAHLSALRRLASGTFTIEESVTLDALRAAADQDGLQAYLVPMQRALTQFDTLTLDPPAIHAVRNGKFIPAPHQLSTPLAAAYDAQHNLIALMEFGPNGMLKPKKVFAN